LRRLEKTSPSNKLLLKQFEIFSYSQFTQTQSQLRWQKIAGNTEGPVLPADLTSRKLINNAGDTHSFRCLLIQLATNPAFVGRLVELSGI